MSGLILPPKTNRSTGYRAYKASQPTAWTRIDMLLALYTTAIEHVQAAIRTLSEGQAAQSLVHRTRAAALVVAIRSGVDLTLESGQRTDQLCEFMQRALGEGDEAHMASTLRVLRELHAGFAGIRDQAVQMEHDGRLPPIPTTPQLDATL